MTELHLNSGGTPAPVAHPTTPDPSAPTTTNAAAPAKPQGLGRLKGAWSRFWFTPQDSSVFALWRTALGFTVFWWMISFSWDLLSFFGEEGLRPNPTYADFRIGAFQWFESNTAIYAMYAMVLVTSLLVMVGKALKLAAPLMFYGVLSFELDNLSVLNAGDSLIRIWPLFLAVFVLFTPGRLTGISLWGRRPGRSRRPARAALTPLREMAGGRKHVPMPKWMLRVVQIQMSVIYPASAIGKFPGNHWHDGTAALYAMQVTDFQRFPVPEFVQTNQILGAAMTWYTLGLETLIVPLLWYPRTRRFAIFAGLTLHLGFGYTMRLGFFSWVMAIGYIAFLKPSEARRIIGWLDKASFGVFSGNRNRGDEMTEAGVGGGRGSNDDFEVAPGYQGADAPNTPDTPALGTI